MRRTALGRGMRLASQASILGLTFMIVGDNIPVTAAVGIGIDPLQILDTQVKPNVLFVVDTGRSMGNTIGLGPSNSTPEVGGDDLYSRFYTAKVAMRTALSSYQNEANFGLLAMQPDPATHYLASPHSNNKRGGLIYVTTDSNGSVWAGLFASSAPSSFSDYDELTESPNSLESSSSLGFSAGYPSGCASGSCRYYLKSRLFRDGSAIYINKTTGAYIQASNSVDCSTLAPPAGRLSADSATYNDGTGRACFQLLDEGGGSVATYWFSSALFSTEDDASPPAAGATAVIPNTGTYDNGMVQNLAACTASNYNVMIEKLRLELPITTSGSTSLSGPGLNLGDPSGLNPLTSDPASSSNDLSDDSTGGQGQPSYGTWNLPTSTTSATNTSPLPAGLRLGYETDIAGALDGADDYFGSITTLPGQGNFIILLTQGAESSGSNATAKTKAAALYNGTPRVETIVLVLNNTTTGSAAIQSANEIAQSGSGGTRNAYLIDDLSDVSDAVAYAMSQTAPAGSFSAATSVTTPVWELVESLKNWPAPAASPVPSAKCSTCANEDPETRFDSQVPVLFQPSFEMPGFKGHLIAFRSDSVDGDPIKAWGTGGDAGQKLFDIVAYGRPSATTTSPGGGMGKPPTTLTKKQTDAQDYFEWTFDQLAGGVIPTTPPFSTMSGKIRRRIFTSTRNGTFAYASDVKPESGSNGSAAQRPYLLWPHNGLSATLDGTSLDQALGITGTGVTFSTLQDETGACKGITSTTQTVGGSTAEACKTGSLAAAQREARQILLAYVAGAELSVDNETGYPRRVIPSASVGTSGAPVGDLLFKARSWILAESTLASPAVIGTPLELDTGSFHLAEYEFFRDGPRDSTQLAKNGIAEGFGLRNSELDGSTATPSTSIRPRMTVVYYPSNAGLHAFRAGPNCDYSTNTAVLTDTTANDPAICSENGGEELWAYIPFDQLSKIKSLLKGQTRANKTYMIASSIRFVDVFVPGSSLGSVDGVSIPGTGKWRTMIFFGRGQGGKYYTALDVTSPGTYKTDALGTNAPGVVWNRGNPDTVDGTSSGTAVNAADTAAYLKMGQTWSVPAVGRVLENFYLYTGSGYGTAISEGSTFYILNAINGNVVFSQDVCDRASTATGCPTTADPAVSFDNAFVGSPTALNPENGKLVSGGAQIQHPAKTEVTKVYAPDINGRVWLFPADGLSSGTLFADLGATSGAGTNQPQPIGVGGALLNFDPGTGTRPHYFVVTGHDSRVTQTSNPLNPTFLMVGLRDDDLSSDPDSTDEVVGPATKLFVRKIDDLDDDGAADSSTAPGFRGTTAPTVTFETISGTIYGRVFFAGVRFPGTDATTCVPDVESVIYGLGASTGNFAYDYDSGTAGTQGAYIAQNVAVGLGSQGGKFVVDAGVDPTTVPAPPAAPSTVGAVSTGSSSTVYTTKARTTRSSVCNNY